MYRKPELIQFDDLAEGIYAFSGDVYEEQLEEFVAEETAPSAEPTAGGASYSLVLTNAWDGNKQYDIIFTNESSEQVDAVSVTVSCVGTVTSIGGNVSAALNGDTAEITFNNYGNGIPANSSTEPVYVLVTGDGDFRIE